MNYRLTVHMNRKRRWKTERYKHIWHVSTDAWHSWSHSNIKTQIGKKFLLCKDSNPFISTGMEYFSKINEVMINKYEILRKYRDQNASEDQTKISKYIKIITIKAIWVSVWKKTMGDINGKTIKAGLKPCRNTKQFLLKSWWHHFGIGKFRYKTNRI